MSSVDDRLHDVAELVEKSSLSEQEKNDVYDTIRVGLHATVWPVLAKHAPKEKLSELVAKGSSVQAEEYISLVNDTIGDGNALYEIESLMLAVIDTAEEVLKKEFTN